MAITFVIAKSAPSDSTTATTAAVDTSGANLLVLVETGFAAPTATPTDSKSNTWTGTTAQGTSRMHYCWNPSSVGSGHTFQIVQASSYIAITMMAFAGVQTSSDPFDQRTGASSAVSPGSITPAASGELFVATVGGDGATWDSMTESTVFTLPTNGRQTYIGGTTEAVQGWYQINTDSSARNPVFSASGNALMLSFKASAGAAARGLFRTPSQSGIGGGGSFFRDPLQAAPYARRDRVYGPARMSA